MSSVASLGIAIMAVPERRTEALALATKLDLRPEVLVWDETHAGHLPTWWRAVELACAGSPSHIMILEDDAIPAPDVVAAVKLLIARHPDRIFSLYSNLRSVDQARAEGMSLLACYRMGSDVAMVYPRAWLDDLRVDYEPCANEFRGQGADEMRLSLRPQQIVWATVPSLVQHGQPVVSTLGHHHPRQLARWFIGANTSALSVDWSNA